MNKTSKHILQLCKEAKSLRVIVPDEVGFPDSGSSDNEIYIFNQVNADVVADAAKKEATVVVKRVIHDSDHSRVYLGNFKGVEVVLKCCCNVEFYRDFRREAKAYERRLSELQGTIVPSFFGYYLAEDEEYGPYSILLMEYCGERVSELFRFLDINVRLHILNMLGNFHIKSGLHLTDFAERNVVYRNGKFRLIHFQGHVCHDCNWTEDVDWRVGEYDLDVRLGFPCYMLGDAAAYMHIWSFKSKLLVSIYGRSFPASEFPPQHIVDRLATGRFLSSTRNWEWLGKYMRQIKKEFDLEGSDFDIEKRVAERPNPPLHSIF